MQGFRDCYKEQVHVNNLANSTIQTVSNENLSRVCSSKTELLTKLIENDGEDLSEAERNNF